MKKKVYKVRHKATGLFYRPGSDVNLAKDGKVYTTKNTILTFMRDGYAVDVNVTTNSKIYKEYANIFDKLEFHPGKAVHRLNCSYEDFELVEYEIELKEIGIAEY